MKLWNSIGAERSQTCRGDPGEKVGTELAGFPAAPRAIGANVRSATPAYRQNERAADVFHAV
jgi:hypothetical protein